MTKRNEQKLQKIAEEEDEYPRKNIYTSLLRLVIILGLSAIIIGLCMKMA